MSLLDQIRSLSPADRALLVQTFVNGTFRSAEADVALRLIEELRIENEELSAAYHKLCSIIRQDYSRTLVGQSYNVSEVSDVAMSAFPAIACKA